MKTMNYRFHKSQVDKIVFFFFNETLAMLPKLSKALNGIRVICLQLAC